MQVEEAREYFGLRFMLYRPSMCQSNIFVKFILGCLISKALMICSSKLRFVALLFTLDAYHLVTQIETSIILCYSLNIKKDRMMSTRNLTKWKLYFLFYILNTSRYPDIHIAIYTGDLDADPEKILSQTEKTFNMKLQPNIEFVYLHGRKWVEASTYPYFTLLGQSLGSVYLGIEALNNLTPGDVIDCLTCN